MYNRSERARRRAARRKNTRTLLIAVLAIILAVVGYFAFSSLFGKDKAPQSGETKTLPGGLIIEDVVVGTGTEAKTGSNVTVHYTGWLEDGTKFDSSKDSGQPFPFTVGAGGVIPGWDQGIPGMKVGGTRRLTIPPDLAYGPSGYGPIPPNATLTFEVELLEVR